jgi:hypothetical protein
METNIVAAWIGFLMGCMAGAVPGLLFYNQEWLGGYASWPRRMLRLAHIAFFGIALLNIAFAFTIHVLHLENYAAIPSVLLIVGAVTMPLICYLSAWKPGFRHAFFIPAMSVTLAIVMVLWRILIR